MAFGTFVLVVRAVAAAASPCLRDHRASAGLLVSTVVRVRASPFLATALRFAASAGTA
jgi:hypothetical protein